MGNGKKVVGGLFVLFAWALLGAIVGTGGGYFVYAKKPALFESTAEIQISRNDPPASHEGRAGDPESQSAPDTDSTGATEPSSAGDPQHGGGESKNRPDTGAGGGVDESHFILSDPVLAHAVQSGRLRGLPGLSIYAGDSAEANDQSAEALRESGSLNAERIADGWGGGIYQVRFRSKTPSASQEVVQAVVASCAALMSETVSCADWNESLTILGESRAEVTRRISQLEDERGQLAIPDDAVLHDGAVVSAAVETFKRLNPKATRLQSEVTALEEKLRLIETLVSEGVSADQILVSLGQVSRPDTPTPAGSAETENREAQRAAEYQRRLEERARLTREVQLEVEPLQRELDKLLEKLGTGHPTVRHVQGLIDRARARLDALPPLEEESPSEETGEETNVEESPGEGGVGEPPIGVIKAAQVARLLRLLRAQKRSVDEELAEVTSELDDAIALVARQEHALIEAERLGREIEQQQAMYEQITLRLTKLSEASPVPTASLTVLRAPSIGVQVAPALEPHLLVGGISGVLCGLVLAALILATSNWQRE